MDLLPTHDDVEVFASQGITGYLGTELQIAPQSMFRIDGLGDAYWRVHMDITQQPDADFPLTTDPITTKHRVFFRYINASDPMTHYYVCQVYHTPEDCPIPSLWRAPEGTY